MTSYCLKCEENIKNIILQVSMYLLYVVIKNHNLLKNKKQKGY